MIEEWLWWRAAGESIRVIARKALWDIPLCDVASPVSGRIHRLSPTSLQPLTAHHWTAAEVRWRAAAARAVAMAASGEPIVAGFVGIGLLPHQLAAVERALGNLPVRVALCDEVGLGKTVTAGAIFAELKARGVVRRTLVVAPKGVQLQWVAEFANRFQEEFVQVGREGVPIDAGFNPWRSFPQVVCTLDAVKPIRFRAGWDAERVAAYNEQRFRAVVDAGWDLVIIDEAHHVAGSTDTVARHRLARALAEVAPHCLLLTATPHSGKTDGFRRFLGLIDPSFLEGRALNRTTVGEVVSRTEKRAAVDNMGQPLFTPRTSEIQAVPYGGRVVEQALYEAVTEYVREGYGRSVRERRPAVGFLVLLMQRLVSSSTAAIQAALERRLATLDAYVETPLGLFDEEWTSLTGEEQFNALATIRGVAWAAERREVEHLLDLARRANSAGPDAKALFFLQLLRRLKRDEEDPRLKVLVFTEFVPTQEMILNLLKNAGIPAVEINGTMGLAERAQAQEAFRTSAQVLVSTDAGGEGINLQFAHIVVNWDLPWSPSRLEQRLGRVDRIGQRHPVRAFNLVMENSVDARVLDVLEQKLAVILDEFGVDKRTEILDAIEIHTDSLYAEALNGSSHLTASAECLVERTRAELQEQAPLRSLLPDTSGMPSHTGDRLKGAIAVATEAWQLCHGQALDDTTTLLDAIPSVAPGEPVPVVQGPTRGWWGVWEVRDDAAAGRRNAFAVFLPDGGGVRPDVSETVWDALMRIESNPMTLIPSEAVWDHLARTSSDYGYRPCAQLSGGGRPTLPWVRPLLIVRVE